MKSSALIIQHLSAFVQDKQILSDISCVFKKRTTTVLMGPNGSGKTTFAHILMGDPKYKVRTSITLNGKDITNAPAEKRARMGLFLSFQSPVAIPGVSVKELLKASYHALEKSKKESLSSFNKRIQSVSTKLRIDNALLGRGIHEEFSGGERKKIELLQALVLRPTLAIFDEIDTGVDFDGLQLIAKGIGELKKDGTGIILITHSDKILRYIKVDAVLVMARGRIIKVGTGELIHKINTSGYTHL